MEEFYIQQEGKEKLYHYNILPAFGDLATSFSTDSSYQTIEQRNRLKEDKLLEIKKPEKV
jgi:hypothetical protein